MDFDNPLKRMQITKQDGNNHANAGKDSSPLIPASFNEEKGSQFGKDIPMERLAQPVEIVPCYIFLASREGAFTTGQVLHPNGGSIVNS